AGIGQTTPVEALAAQFVSTRSASNPESHEFCVVVAGLNTDRGFEIFQRHPKSQLLIGGIRVRWPGRDVMFENGKLQRVGRGRACTLLRFSGGRRACTLLRFS